MLDVTSICAPQGEWIDTPEQATLRGCLIACLADLDPVDQMRVGRDLVNLMRDQLMGAAGAVRKHAARVARETYTPEEIIALTGLSGATVSRLLTRANDV
jgi:hypothetical protein